MSAKARQKHSVDFPKLINEYGKEKRHSVGKMVENDFWVFLNIFGVSGANFPGKRKWEQVDSRQMSNKCNGARVAR
jgi:hypothetical protein